MAYIDNQKNPIKTIDKFHYEVLTKNDTTGYTHPAMKNIEGLIRVNFGFQKSEGELWADGYRMIAESSISAVDVTLDAVSIPAEDLSEMLGRDYTTDTMTISADDVSPEIVIGFRAQMKDGQFAFYKFYVGVAQLNDTSMETATGSKEYQTSQLVIKCNPRAMDKHLSQIKFSDTDISDTFFGAAV